ncbi:MAG: hypothetical protein ABL958_09950 [Bdellovibrionia bacterium]
MKAFITVLVLGFGVSASAADLLKITAFYPLNGTRGASELCGKVSGQVFADYRLIVTADPKYNPGKYTTLPGPDGNFCVIVNSVTGRADVDLIKAGTSSATVNAVTDVQTSRYVKP